MSMNYGQDTIGIHFTWKSERDAVEDMLVQLESARSVRGTPALGQALQRGHEAIAPLYERRPDFIRLVERLDPARSF